MLMGFLFAAVILPQPSPSPLKTITHVHSSPFCTAFGDNIRKSVKNVLVNDALFNLSKPVFLQAAHDMIVGGPLQSSFGSMGPAQSDPDNAAAQLDMNRLTVITASIAKNLEAIDALLNDAARFPKKVQSNEDKQLVQLRDQILALAQQQNAELNALSGSTDRYTFDSLYNSGPSGTGALNAGPAPGQSGVDYYGLGPISQTPRPLPRMPSFADPQLVDNSVFMRSWIGHTYQLFTTNVDREAAMEFSVSDALTAAAAQCK